MFNSGFFEKVACGLLVCKNDSYSTIVTANSAFYQMIGYTKEEMSTLFKNRFMELLLDDITAILEKINQSIRGNGILNYEYRIRHKSGRTIWIHDMGVYDSQEDVFNLAIMDITYKEEVLEGMSKEASIDKLTGLLNRSTLEKRIINNIKEKESNSSQVMFLIDMDNFKIINDTRGHQFGDKMISYIGKKLKEIDNDIIIGRLGGDEFMAYSSNIKNYVDTRALAQRIVDTLNMEVDGMAVTVSVGAIFDQGGEYDFEMLYAQADKALYKVKENDKGKYELITK